MRLSPYLKEQIKRACEVAFGECKVILFGSRVDDAKKGGDFDIAVDVEISKEAFNKKRVHFFKYFLLNDLDLPIDLVHYNSAHELLKEEINKGVVL